MIRLALNQPEARFLTSELVRPQPKRFFKRKNKFATFASITGKPSRLRPGDDRGEIRVHDLINLIVGVDRLEHVEYGSPVRVLSVIVNNRVPVSTSAFRGQLQILLGHFTAVPFRAFGLHVERAKQSTRELLTLGAGVSHRV